MPITAGSTGKYFYLIHHRYTINYLVEGARNVIEAIRRLEVNSIVGSFGLLILFHFRYMAVTISPYLLIYTFIGTKKRPWHCMIASTRRALQWPCIASCHIFVVRSSKFVFALITDKTCIAKLNHSVTSFNVFILLGQI